MNRRHLLALTVLVSLGFVASDVSSAITTRELSAGVSTQVSIGPAGAEPWSTTMVEVDIEAVRTLDANGRPVFRPGKKTWERSKFSKILQGVIGSTFETDLAPNVTQIAFEPTVFEIAELSAAPDPAVNIRFRAGPVKPGRVTFTLPNSRAITDWVRGYTTGRVAPRDITVNMKNAGGGVVRSLALKRAMPTSYATDGKFTQLTVQPEALVLGGAAHRALAEWAQAALNGAATPRDLKIAYVDMTGAPLGATTLKASLITEISWSTLSASNKDAIRESFAAQPETVDPLP